MGSIIIHAGDFSDCEKHRFTKKGFEYKQPPKLKGFFGGIAKLVGLYYYLWTQEIIQPNQIVKLEQVTEDNKVKVLGAFGWGIAGLAIFGPAGAAAGAFLGGRGKKVTFTCEFEDGRMFIGSSDMKTWIDLQAAHFNNNRYLEGKAKRNLKK